MPGYPKKILIIYKNLPQYRKDFYCRLREALKTQGIEMNLIYGKLKNRDASKKDEIDIDWANYIDNKVFKIGNVELYWQPCLKEVLKHDLVIVEQANKLLINYLLIMLRKIFPIKFAFWGHGINLMLNSNSFQNRFKKLYINECDWWFAYTEGVKKIIAQQGFDENKITAVQNTIDTKKLRDKFNSINRYEIEKLRFELKLTNGPVGIFCGSIYKEKRIDFLLEACLQIKKAIPDFNLLVIGAGPQQHLVEKAAASHEWIHYVGPKFDEQRLPYFKISDVLLLPDAVGLSVIDSFAFQTPIITTKGQYHGPEIEYLIDGENGSIVNTISPKVYAAQIIRILDDKARLNALKRGCRNSIEKYSLEQMVANYADGICRCLHVKSKNKADAIPAQDEIPNVC